jgi:membrane-associated protease RseP (regulator of RpoE activity)
MAFEIYDIILLALFILFISLFLYKKRKNLKREGLLFLYRTSWGIKLINTIGKKYTRTLKVLSYVSITLGYFLMAGMVYLFGKIFWIYATNPNNIIETIKVPPIVPLVPYLPQIFNVDFLPPFYFTYWILILVIIAVTHEFSHGIFAIYNKVRIKTTGFGFFPYFLPVFLAAFVELDEKQMAKKSKFGQLAVLSAGTFANILTAVFFFLILWVFFSLAFVPAGVTFDSYSYTIVPAASITLINNISLSNPNVDQITPLIKEDSLNKIEAGGTNYAGIMGFSNDNTLVALYDDAPAINSDMDAIILEINGEKVTSVESFKKELMKYSSGEKITIKTKGDKIAEKEIILGENPKNESLPFLGVAFTNKTSGSVTAKLLVALTSFKKSNVYYEPIANGLSLFIYNLLWWLILISLSVALVNMLPMGIFDGGRFFYLTVLAITKNEKISKKMFSLISFLLFFLILMIIFFWIITLF